MKNLFNEQNKGTLFITVISTIAIELLYSIANDVIIPIIDSRVDNKDDENDLKAFRNYQVKFLGGKINLGSFLLTLIKVIFILVIIYLFVKNV